MGKHNKYDVEFWLGIYTRNSKLLEFLLQSFTLRCLNNIEYYGYNYRFIYLSISNPTLRYYPGQNKFLLGNTKITHALALELLIDENPWKEEILIFNSHLFSGDS